MINRTPTTPSVPRRALQLHQKAVHLCSTLKATRHRLCNAAVPAASAQTAGPAAAAVVRPISSKPHPLDPSTGYVVTEADSTKVPDSFHQLLSSLVTAYQSACGSRLVGVYLRGSLPRGLFLPGISDVDTFAVVLPVTTAAVQHNSSSSSDVEPAVGSSSSDSLHDLQQAVKRLSEPAVQAHQHLGYTKVEVKVLQVEPDSPAAATLTVLLQQQQQQQQQVGSSPQSSSTSTASAQHTTSSSSSSIDAYQAHNGSPPLVLRPAMSASIPYAFELKTASTCLAGLNVPQLLHPSAALPPQFEVLADLASSVEGARAAAVAAAAAGAAAGDVDGSDVVAAAGQGAAAAGAAVDTHNVDVQVRATKWALKRLLRGAFELVQDRAGCYTRDLYWCCEAAKQHIPELQQQLSWTPQQQQQQRRQQWHEQLDSALQLYVNLQSALLQYQQYQQQANLHLAQQHDRGPIPHAAAAAAAADGLDPSLATPAAAAAVLAEQQHLQRLIDSSWQLIDVLLPKLYILFLKAMLLEEPGWLTKHAGYPVPACAGSGSSRSSSSGHGVLSSSDSSGSSRSMQPSRVLSQQQAQQQQQQQQEQSPWLFAGKAVKALQRILSQTAAAAAAGASDSAAGAISEVLGAVPPAAKIPVMGQVQAYEWQQEGRTAGAAAVRHILSTASSRTHSTTSNGSSFSLKPLNDSSSSSSSSRSGHHAPAAAAEFELLGSWPQPVVLRGAAASWPCVTGGWDLTWLAQQGIEGKVRVAPSLQFPFVEPQLLEILLKLKGVKAAPSILTDMPASEFVQRLQPGCRMPPIAYIPTESYYWQAGLPQHLKQQEPLNTLLEAFSGTGFAQQKQQPKGWGQEQRVAVTQQPRLWVSPAGAVSPLHYDKSHSFLVQVAGTKRMLFFSPDQLHRLYCYPDTHILRRRSRVNVSSPDVARFPLFAEAAALEAVLHPGDVVCFPPYWSHYTESLGQAGQPSEPVGCSMSITFRCQAGEG